jgi:hypothetical protein
MEEGIVPEGGTKGGFVGFWYIAESPREAFNASIHTASATAGSFFMIDRNRRDYSRV